MTRTAATLLLLGLFAGCDGGPEAVYACDDLEGIEACTCDDSTPEAGEYCCEAQCDRNTFEPCQDLCLP